MNKQAKAVVAVEKLSVPFWKYKMAVKLSNTKTITNKIFRITFNVFVSISILKLANLYKISAVESVADKSVGDSAVRKFLIFNDNGNFESFRFLVERN